MNLLNFWYGTSLYFDSFRGTNHTVFCLLLLPFYYLFIIIFTALRLAAASALRACLI